MAKALARRSVTHLIVCAILVACGSEGPVLPDVPDAASAAATINSLLSEIGSSQTAAASAQGSGGSPAPPSSDSSTDAGLCSIDLANRRFNCPPRTLPNGLTMSGYFQILDGSGEPQTAFDTLTTTGIRMVTDLSGTIQMPLMTENGPVPATQTISNHDEITLSGIRTGQRRHNGTGTMTNTIVPQGMPTATISATTAIINLEFSQDTSKHYPVAGSITASITSVTGTQPPVTISQVTTYDGTAIAKTVITLPNGSTRTCTYSMTSQGTPPTCTGP